MPKRTEEEKFWDSVWGGPPGPVKKVKRPKPDPKTQPTFFTRGGKKYLVPPVVHHCTREEIEHVGGCEWSEAADEMGVEFAYEHPEKDVRKDITVYFVTSDGHRETRKFKSLFAARRYAQSKIGEAPDHGGHYAVSAYGDAKILAHNASMNELFPRSAY